MPCQLKRLTVDAQRNPKCKQQLSKHRVYDLFTTLIIAQPHDQSWYRCILSDTVVHLRPRMILESLFKNGLGMASSPSTSGSHTGTGGSSFSVTRIL